MGSLLRSAWESKMVLSQNRLDYIRSKCTPIELAAPSREHVLTLSRVRDDDPGQGERLHEDLHHRRVELSDLLRHPGKGFTRVFLPLHHGRDVAEYAPGRVMIVWNALNRAREGEVV